MRDDAAIQCKEHAQARKETDLDLIVQILRVQERIILTDGYGPPAMLVFWLGIAAFYASRIRRACPHGLWSVSRIVSHVAIFALARRRG
jgi:hypothetical protein